MIRLNNRKIFIVGSNCKHDRVRTDCNCPHRFDGEVLSIKLQDLMTGILPLHEGCNCYLISESDFFIKNFGEAVARLSRAFNEASEQVLENVVAFSKLMGKINDEKRQKTRED